MMRIGESRMKGPIIYTKIKDYFIVECSICGWREEHKDQPLIERLVNEHYKQFITMVRIDKLNMEISKCYESYFS